MNSTEHFHGIQHAAGDVLRLVNTFALAREPKQARLVLDRLEAAYAAYRARHEAATASEGVLSDEHAKQVAEFDAKVTTAYESIMRGVA